MAWQCDPSFSFVICIPLALDICFEGVSFPWHGNVTHLFRV